MSPSDDAPTAAGTIDVHAHWFPEHLGNHGRQRLSLLPTGENEGQIILDGRPFRTVDRRLWDASARTTWVRERGWATQVISPIPVAMEVAVDEEPNFAAAINDDIAGAVGGSQGHLLGMGCLPLANPDAARTELRRIARIGLVGVEIGTRAGAYDLDDPVIEALLAEASSLNLAVLVLPVAGGSGVIRQTGRAWDFGLGMLTDSAIAAGSLVLGGVLARLPDLRIAFCHGCGSFAYAWPRLRLGAALFDGTPTAGLDDLVRRLYVDTLTFDPALLAQLVDRFGPDRLVFGTDDPFFPNEPDDGITRLHAACRNGLIPYADPIGDLARNARAYLAV